MSGKVAASRAISRLCRGGCFSPPAVRPRLCRRVRPAEVQIQPSPRHQISNREAIRLEIRATPTKQRMEAASNREKTPAFQTQFRGSPRTGPSNLLRLDRCPTDCFQRLTRLFNRTHVAIKSESAEGKRSGPATQNQQSSQPSQFLIRSPRRTNHPALLRDLPANPRSTRPKRFLDALVKIAFADTDHRQIATLAGFGENFAEELAFGSVQQGMCSQNFRQRRKRPAPT